MFISVIYKQLYSQGIHSIPFKSNNYDSITNTVLKLVKKYLYFFRKY